MEDIFNDENKVSGSFFKFAAVGDKVQGTYVGKSEKPDSYKAGEMQQIYELLGEDGGINLVGGKAGIDRQMKHVKFGQIVGMEFIKETPPRVPGQNATHVIQVFANPNVVNEEWLKDKNELTPVEVAEDDGKITVEEVDQLSDEAAKDKAKTAEAIEVMGGEDDDTKKLNKIGELAKAKLGVADAAGVSEAVMNETKLAFIASNYDEIIKMLEAK